MIGIFNADGTLAGVVESLDGAAIPAGGATCAIVNGVNHQCCKLVNGVVVHDQTLMDAQLLNNLRSARDEILRNTDHTQVHDHPLKADTAVIGYRQALRDLPENTTDLTAVEWPEPPASILHLVG